MQGPFRLRRAAALDGIRVWPDQPVLAGLARQVTPRHILVLKPPVTLP